MSAHCSWCADPYRAVLLSLIRQGIRPAPIARHYGVRYTTVVETSAEARRKGCLGPPKCLYCPTTVTRVGGLCEAARCVRLYGRDYMRKRRKTGAHKARRGRQLYDVPEGFVWPALPRNKRERSVRRPPRKPVSPSGMLIATATFPASSPQGFIVVGGGRTAPIGANYCARIAA